MVPIGIVIQWCVTDVLLLHKRHPSFLSFILTMADHHLSLLLFKVSNEFVCSASLIAVLAILWIQLLVVQYLGTRLFEAPLAIRCRRFYSKPLQNQQNHDNQVDHIRASRPL